MASNVITAAVQQALNLASATAQINTILATYGLTLPAVADVTTGQISTANIATLLAQIAGNAANDINGRRAADSATLSQLLQFAGLSGTALSALPTVIIATGALTSTNQIVNSASTVVLTLPSPASMIGQPITISTVQAAAVNSASSNVIPLNSRTAGTAILAATAGKNAVLVSDGTNYQIVNGN
jgi:hypothetical protein